MQQKGFAEYSDTLKITCENRTRLSFDTVNRPEEAIVENWGEFVIKNRKLERFGI